MRPVAGDAAGGYTRGRLWRAGARLTGPLVPASFDSFLAGARKEYRFGNKVNDHLRQDSAGGRQLFFPKRLTIL